MFLSFCKEFLRKKWLKYDTLKPIKQNKES